MKFKGHRKLVALVLLAAVALVAHLTGGVNPPMATVLTGLAASFMAGNGAEHFAARGQQPTLPSPASQPLITIPAQPNTAMLLEQITGQLKDQGEALVALLKKT